MGGAHICAGSSVFFKPGYRVGASLILISVETPLHYRVLGSICYVDTRAATAVFLVQIFFFAWGGAAGSLMPDALSWDGNRDVSSLYERFRVSLAFLVGPIIVWSAIFLNSRYLPQRPTVRLEWEGTSLSLSHPLLVRGIEPGETRSIGSQKLVGHRAER